jgi:hypothetical protein
MEPNEPHSNVLNPSEPFRTVQQSSEAFRNLQSTSKRTGGVGRGKKYKVQGAEIPEQGYDDYDDAEFVLMEQAYALFESGGERRSLRMIGEYCKTGELVCMYDSDDKRWHITRDSIVGKLEKIKALNARKAAIAPQHTSETFTEPPPAAPRPAEGSSSGSEAAPPSSEAIKKLEAEILDLKITNRAKDYMIDQMQKERVDFINRIESGGRLIGKLTAQLLQLMPGRRPQGNEADAPTPDTTTDPPLANEPTDAIVLDDDDDDYENPPQGSFAAA